MKAFRFSQHSSSLRPFHSQQKHHFERTRGDISKRDLQQPDHAPAALPAWVGDHRPHRPSWGRAPNCPQIMCVLLFC